MTGPRPLPNPEPVVWAGFIATIAVAGLAGAGVVWWLTRGWPR